MKDARKHTGATKKDGQCGVREWLELDPKQGLAMEAWRGITVKTESTWGIETKLVEDVAATQCWSPRFLDNCFCCCYSHFVSFYFALLSF